MDAASTGSHVRTSSPALSNSPSIASETFAPPAVALFLPTYLTAASPPAEYISKGNASRIASSVQSSPVVPIPGRSLDHDAQEDVERSLTVISVGAVSLLNSFLDKILYDILSTGRSTSIATLRHATQSILRKSLARDAIACAQANLEDLLAIDDDETDEETQAPTDVQSPTLPQKLDASNKWNQEAAWKRLRLRVMMRSELSEFDIDDDERHAPDATSGSDSRQLQAHVKITLSTEIFLASILDFLGENFLTAAVPVAFSRAHRRSLQTKTAPTAHTLVEEPDIEKTILNSPLDRAWRAWRKSLRGRPHSAASQRLRTHSTASSPAYVRRASSTSTGLPAPVDDLSMPGSMPGAFVETPGLVMPEIPEYANGSHEQGKHDANLYSSRRQSGPMGTQQSSKLHKQRSASVPTIVAGHHKLSSAASSVTTDPVPEPYEDIQSLEVGESRRQSREANTAQLEQQAGEASTFSDPPELATPELQYGDYGTAKTAKSFSAGTAALVRHVSPKQSSPSLQRSKAPDELSIPQRRASAELDAEKRPSPKSRHREAAIGMGYQNGISMPGDPDSNEPEVFPSRTSSDHRAVSPGRSTSSDHRAQSTSSDHPAISSSSETESQPRVPQDPVHIKQIRAQRAQSASSRGTPSPTLSSTSPKMGFRSRALSHSKSSAPESAYPRSDSLRRLAVENNSSSVSLVDEDRNKIVTRSPLLGSPDFDSLVHSGSTIKLTLSPQTVRDGSGEVVTRSSFEQQPAFTSVAEPSARKSSSRQVTKQEITVPYANNVIEEEGSPDLNGEFKPRATTTTFPRPHHLRNKAPAHEARDATVQSHSTQDFADFIRSTGPNSSSQSRLTALPSPTTQVAGPSSGGKKADTRIASPASPAVTSRAGLKIPNRFKAREAKGSSDAGGDNSDLIDFIRNGPGSGVKNKSGVDKSIAPFRTTMDSDELRAMTDKVNAAIANGSGTPGASSFMIGTPNTSMTGRDNNRASISTTYTTQTYNSRVPLVGGGMPDSSAAPSIISALGNVTPGSDATPRLGTSSSPTMDDDGRKRYRNKDIYALPSDDEEDFSHATTQPSATAPRLTGLGFDGVEFHPSSITTTEAGSSSRSKPPTPSPPRPSELASGSPASRPGGRPKLEMKSPGSANKAFKKAEISESTRQTRDLADLFNSAPPSGLDGDDDDRAPGPIAGHSATKPDGKKGKFWRRKKQEA